MERLAAPSLSSLTRDWLPGGGFGFRFMAARDNRVNIRVDFAWGPEVQPYGLKELAFEDPNGYLVCLAEDVD